MRIALVAVALPLALLAAGCGSKKSASSTAIATAPSTNKCAKSNLPLTKSGVLTIGTDNPAFPPWYGGGSPSGSKWKVNDPSTGKGYESAVAYAVAKGLGFPHAGVRWVYVPFNRAFAPGKKPFDFDINQISFTPARAKVVDFSDSYYDVNQAVVVRKGTPISKVTSVAGLKPYKLGAQLGTTSYAYIKSSIDPSKTPAVFPQNAGAVQSLKNGQIDGLVVDLPTAFYVTAVQVPNAKILGRFPAQPGGEHFGLVFAKGSPLVGCTNAVIAKLASNGTLNRLQEQWLAKANGAPTLH
jgi:polar amino acid transport system substrate-binding protein